MYVAESLFWSKLRRIRGLQSELAKNHPAHHLHYVAVMSMEEYLAQSVLVTVKNS